MTSTPQYIKSSVILNKIAALEATRVYADADYRITLDAQIEVLKEILKPQ